VEYQWLKSEQVRADAAMLAALGAGMRLHERNSDQACRAVGL
jgi:hypothetical protein